jgi:hypothetical protein
MSRTTRILFTGTAALALAACADFMNSGANTLAVGPAFQSVPVGFSANSSSFDASGDAGMPFFPGAMGPGGPGAGFRDGGPGHPGGPGMDRHGDGDHRDGFGGPGMRGMLMGGGLGPDFLGRVPFGRGMGRGPFGAFNLPDACTFDATSGRVSCPDKLDHGLTIKASFAFTDTAGAAQAKFDTTSTDAVNVKVTVNGTRVRRDSSTSVVDHRSDRTVSGLAPGSTQRTVNGTARGMETTTGVRDSVAFTAVRTAGDTTTGLVIPLVDGRPTIPSAGVVVRSMTVTITPATGAATTHSRREQITFDGTSVVSVVITQDGVTKNCTITLPSRKLVCD